MPPDELCLMRWKANEFGDGAIIRKIDIMKNEYQIEKIVIQLDLKGALFCRSVC